MSSLFPSRQIMSSFETIGTLLAAIAHLITDGLRILSLADKRQWGLDEQEQVHALERVLDDAKKDFQGLSPLVNGQIYYENDRKRKSFILSYRLLHDSVLVLSRTWCPWTSIRHVNGVAKAERRRNINIVNLSLGDGRMLTQVFSDESIEELRLLRLKFDAHIQNLRDWSRSGGPINPIWVRETHGLQTELHRAQCRAARRIFTSEKEASARCLGAFLVYRKQRQWANKRPSEREVDHQNKAREELVACNSIGSFERFGDGDVAFICDYCDGHMIWEDLENMPSIRTAHEAEMAPTSPDSATSPTSPTSPVAPAAQTPQWQATGFTAHGHREKQIVYAPVVIANHIVPQHADYIAGLICPYCEELAGEPKEEYDEEEEYRPDNCFEDVAALQEHLEWEHNIASQTSSLPLSGADNCVLM